MVNELPLMFLPRNLFPFIQFFPLKTLEQVGESIQSIWLVRNKFIQITFLFNVILAIKEEKLFQKVKVPAHLF
jgi:hypothetical protein